MGSTDKGNGVRLALGMTAGAIAIISLCIGTAWGMVQGHRSDVTSDIAMIHGDLRDIRQKVDAVWREVGSPPIIEEERE
jgi:hypothetical protein